jgi:Asp-tRNA(Asn)/Glu-tRNA(Gln) amidotransferase C subunit
MTWSKLERVENLSALVGIRITEAEAAEVAERLDSLVRELGKLEALDLSAVEPVCVFADEDGHDA